MRFYRRTDESVLEIRNPRVRFFLLGPFYLLWLRLWQEAILVAVGVGTLVRAATVLTRRIGGYTGGIDLESAFAAIDAMRDVAYAPDADAAFQRLLSSFVPLLAGLTTLLVITIVLTALLPRYLTWRFGRRGWERLVEEPGGEELPIYGV